LELIFLESIGSIFAVNNAIIVFGYLENECHFLFDDKTAKYVR